MKSILRYGVLAALIMVMAAASVVTTNAQGATLCPKGLTADDCSLLTGSKAATSFVMDYTVTAKTAGTTSDFDLEVKGSGPIDVSKVTAGTDPSKMYAGLLFQTKMDASLAAGSQKQAGSIEIRIVDGFIYINGDQATKGKWMKVDLAKVTQSSMSGLPVSPSSLNTAVDPALITALEGLAGDALSGKSADGPTVDGVATKQITVSLDLNALVKSLGTDKGAAAIAQIAAMVPGGASASGMDPKQIQQAVSQFQPMLEPTLKATTISFSWLIDPAAKQYRGFSAIIKTTVDPALAAMMSGGAGGAAPKAISVDLELNVTLSKLGAPVTVDPVADAVDMTSAAGSLGGAK